jgi:putative salt-induced outer membrane protein YdiY
MMRRCPPAFLIALVWSGILSPRAFAECPCPSPPPPPPAFTASLGAGLALTSGNTDTKSFNLAAALQYDPKTRNVIKFDGFYLRAESGGQPTVDKSAFGARDEYALSPRLFAFGEIRYLRDRFKEISYLVTPLVGVGYVLVKSDPLILAVDAGVGGAFEKDDGLGSMSSGSYHVGEGLTWKISGTAALTEKATGLWKTKDASDSLYHFEVALASSIAKHAEVKLAFVEDYKNKPPNPSLSKADEALLFTLLMKF